jgi:hypothetical protein
MLGISWLAYDLLASQERICSTQIFGAPQINIRKLFEWSSLNRKDLLATLRLLQGVRFHNALKGHRHRTQRRITYMLSHILRPSVTIHFNIIQSPTTTSKKSSLPRSCFPTKTSHAFLCSFLKCPSHFTPILLDGLNNIRYTAQNMKLLFIRVYSSTCYFFGRESK